MKKRCAGSVMEQLLDPNARTDRIVEETKETEEDYFGRSVAETLKGFGRHDKRLAMLRIQKVLYDMQYNRTYIMTILALRMCHRSICAIAFTLRTIFPVCRLVVHSAPAAINRWPYDMTGEATAKT